ncbi:anti-sigma factor [Streptomyces hundungensis]|uniref:anti-sigma factor n=1 Tax=Streptomyces hundungensis TaxID=1077946 RepID=UPI001FE3E7C2|nr:anti-sigma factor [Streptomyces hundungensis]
MRPAPASRCSSRYRRGSSLLPSPGRAVRRLISSSRSCRSALSLLLGPQPTGARGWEPSSCGQLKGNATGTLIVARNRDRAVFLATGLSRPPAGKVCQLWFDDAGTMRPAGLISATQTTEAVLLSGPLDHATAMGTTVEPTGGSTQPTTTPSPSCPSPAHEARRGTRRLPSLRVLVLRRSCSSRQTVLYPGV